MRLKRYFKYAGNGAVYGPYYSLHDGNSFHHIDEAEFMRLKELKYEQGLLRKKSRELKSLAAGKGLDDAVKEFFKAAGYNIYRNRLCINMKTFGTLPCAEVRFGLLNDQEKSLVGSAENLLELSLLTLSRQKRYNALGVKGKTLNCCFREVAVKEPGLRIGVQ